MTAHHHGSVDAFSGQGIDVPRSIADDQQVVIEGGDQALAAQTQGGRLHALDLGLGAQRSADEGVVLNGSLMQPLQI